jgi:hypothetical protein
MGLIRRNKSEPVLVQRRSPDPEQQVVDIPTSANPTGKLPLQAHVTQNNFYVSAPPGQLPAASAPVPPTEVHHHHTTVQHIVRTRTVRGLSFFGVVGLVLGGLACAAFFVPGAKTFAHPLALAGLVAAGWGFIAGVLLGRVGVGIPFLGLLVSGAGLAIWFQDNGGHLQAEIEKVRNKLPGELRKIDLGGIGNPTEIPEQPTAPVVAPQPKIETKDAREKLESAREEAAQRMQIDYSGAKSAAEKAKSDLLQARLADAAGSPELIAADQREVEADSALKMIEQKLRSDPAVAAAEQVMKAPAPVHQAP